VIDTLDPQRFQADCVEAFVASWTARGFAASTIAKDVGVLERMLAALGRPVWEVTAADVDRVVGELASSGRAVSTRTPAHSCAAIPAYIDDELAVQLGKARAPTDHRSDRWHQCHAAGRNGA
jgi:hypothetical protein